MIRSLFKFLAVLVIFCGVAGLSAYFTLSFIVKGEDSVVVPNLVGKEAIAGFEMLTHLDLNARVEGSEFSDTIPKNHVIHQEPEPGAVIKKERDVSLVISKGTRNVDVPEIVGQDLAHARIALEENDLTAGAVSYVYAPLAPAGQIMEQTPRSGKSVERASPVNMLISKGRRLKNYQMPDLTGYFLDEAMLAIEDYKMALDGVQSVYDKTKPEDVVVAQAPPAGYHVRQQDKIRLMVNRKTTSSDPSKKPPEVLFRYRLPPGFLKHHIRLELTCYGMQFTVFDHLMPPGAEIWTIIPRQAEGAAFLYVNDVLVQSVLYN